MTREEVLAYALGFGLAVIILFWLRNIFIGKD